MMRLPLVLVLALPMLAGCAAATAQPPDAQPAPSPTSASPSPSATPTPIAVPGSADVTTTPTPQAPPPAPIPEPETADASLTSVQAGDTIAPVRLVISELAIDMPVEAMGLDKDGAMALPENASEAGWYRFGPGLRNDEGATVIASHIDSRHDGIGPFSRLKDASEGSIVSVGGSDGGTVDYVVTNVRSVGKIDAPMAEVFDRSGEPRLTLVTCGGEFDSGTGHYVDNIILTAVPVDAAPAGE